MRDSFAGAEFRGLAGGMNASERYVHPEFGFLSPTPRLRRDLRTAFFSVLFGIGFGAAAVIALSGNNNGDDTRGPHGGRSASVISEEPTEGVLDENSPQPAGIEKSVNKDHTSKPNGSTAEANSENRKTNATTTCEGNNRFVVKFLLPLASRVRRKHLQASERLQRLPRRHLNQHRNIRLRTVPKTGQETRRNRNP